MKILRPDNNGVGAATGSCDEQKDYCKAAHYRSYPLNVIHNKVWFDTSITLDYGKGWLFYRRFFVIYVFSYVRSKPLLMKVPGVHQQLIKLITVIDKFTGNDMGYAFF